MTSDFPGLVQALHLKSGGVKVVVKDFIYFLYDIIGIKSYRLFTQYDHN